MKRRLGAFLGAACLVLLLALQGRAAMVSLEVNGREYFGTVFSDGGEVYAALDVVGPLLLGAQFRFETYDVTLRRCTFTYVPTGASSSRKMEIFGCVKRGAAVYAPLRLLVRQVGGSSQDLEGVLTIAYPPATAVAPTPALPSPTPSRTPTTVPPPTILPTAAPTPMPPLALTPETALEQARSANTQAFAGARLIRSIEVFHPVQPDPSEAIPRTDLAGLRIQTAQLGAGDEVAVSMWRGRTTEGEPVFRQRVSRFGSNEQAKKTLFVRLPLTVEAGWYTVRVQMNGREFVDYRFVTY